MQYQPFYCTPQYVEVYKNLDNVWTRAGYGDTAPWDGCSRSISGILEPAYIPRILHIAP